VAAPEGPPQLDLLMWKSTVLLRVNLKHVKRKMTVVFHFYTFVSRNYVYTLTTSSNRFMMIT